MIAEADIRQFLSRRAVHERLVTNLNGNFWISPDIAILADVKLEPQHITALPVQLDTQHLPYEDAGADTFFYTYAHTRSRFMQLGVEVLNNAGKMIAETCKETDRKRIYQAHIPLANAATRPIHLAAGTKLCNLYSWDGQTVTGQQLVGLLESGDITIGGREGVDWHWSFTSHAKASVDTINGINFLLNPDKQLWLPPDPTNKPISISDATGIDYRALVDEVLTHAPLSDRSLTWIGETNASITLSRKVHGLIDSLVSTDTTLASLLKSYGSHKNSLLITGGRTAWPLRTEIYSPTTKDKLPRYVFLNFALSGRS